MKKFPILLSALLLVGAVSSCQMPAALPDASAKGSLTVVTSFYPMYDFASKIAGNKATVYNLVPAGSEPHDWEPTPTDMVTISDADIFVYNGAGMEQWVDNVLSSVSSDSLITVNASAALTLLPADESQNESSASPAAGDTDHPGAYDPHVWLDPMNAKEEMRAILAAFLQADPANTDYYQANFDRYAKEFDRLDQEFSDALRDFDNRNIVVSHQAFAYLCARYRLTQVAIEGIAADSEPDAARMAEIIDFVTREKVRVIFFEELVSPKVAKAIASEAGVTTDVLNPIDGLTEQKLAAGEDYFSVQRENLQALVKALGTEG